MSRLLWSVFLFVLRFVAVHPGEYDVTNQIAFLHGQTLDTSCWKDKDVVSRTVLVEDEPTSVNSFFDVSSILLLEKWPITERNLNGITRLMKTVLSCEYVDHLHAFVIVFEKYLTSCRALGASEEYRKCADKSVGVLNEVSDGILKMIFTLADFEKYRNGFFSGGQDLLKLLVSWHLNLRDFVGAQPAAASRDVDDYVATMRLIGVQADVDLKELGVAHCRRADEFAAPPADSANDTAAVWELLENVPRTLSRYVSRGAAGAGERSSLIADGGDHERLLDALDRNTRMRVEWNDGEWLTLRQIYDGHVKTTRIAGNVMRYENAVLSVMAKLAHGRLVAELKPLMTRRYVPRQDDGPLAAVLDAVDGFVSLLQRRRVPRILLCRALELSYQARAIVQLHASSPGRRTGAAAAAFARFAASSAIDFAGDSLAVGDELRGGDLADFLGGFVAERAGHYAYLRRDVADALRDGGAYLTAAQPFVHAVDAKNVYTDWTPRFDESDAFCRANVRAAVDAARDALGAASRCADAVARDDVRDDDGAVRDAFAALDGAVQKLRTAVFGLLSSAYRDVRGFVDVDGYLRRAFVTLTCYAENARIAARDAAGARRLVRFHYAFHGALSKYYALACEPFRPGSGTAGPPRAAAAAGQLTADGRSELTRYVAIVYGEPSPGGRDAAAASRTGRLLAAVRVYGDFVRAATDAFRGRHVRFYWRGGRVTVHDVHARLHEYGPADVQRIVEYQYLTVAWIACSLHSALLNLLNGMVFYGLRADEVRAAAGSCLNRRLRYLQRALQNVRRFTSRDVRLAYDEFARVVLDAQVPQPDQHELKNLRTLLIDQLMMFGVVLTTLPNAEGDRVEDYVRLVCDRVDLLEELRFADLFDTIGLTRLLGGKPPFDRGPADQYRVDVEW